MKVDAHPVNHFSIASSFKLICYAAVLIGGPWMITHFWLHTVFHMYYMVPGICIIIGYLLHTANQQISLADAPSTPPSISSLYSDTETLPANLGLLHQYMRHPQKADGKTLIKALSRESLPKQNIPIIKPDQSIRTYIDECQRHTFIHDDLWFTVMLQLIEQITQSHQNGAMYELPGSPSCHINIMNMYRLLNHATETEQTSMPYIILSNLINRIIVSSLNDVIDDLSGQKMAFHSVTKSALKPFNMKYCQVIDQSIRALDELKDTLETSKKPILPESQNACSDFFKLFVDRNKTSNNSSVHQLLLDQLSLEHLLPLPSSNFSNMILQLECIKYLNKEHATYTKIISSMYQSFTTWEHEHDIKPMLNKLCNDSSAFKAYHQLKPFHIEDDDSWQIFSTHDSIITRWTKSIDSALVYRIKKWVDTMLLDDSNQGIALEPNQLHYVLLKVCIYGLQHYIEHVMPLKRHIRVTMKSSGNCNALSPTTPRNRAKDIRKIIGESELHKNSVKDAVINALATIDWDKTIDLTPSNTDHTQTLRHSLQYF